MEEFFVHLSIMLVGSAVLAAVAVMLKQPILLAYIACGVLLGPRGFAWVENVRFMEVISHLGITLLLFLAGLNLHPQKLFQVFKKASIATVGNAIASFIVGYLLGMVFQFSHLDALCIGLAMMFSSTILVVKLLPTTDLHHKHMGAVCIGVLILQDLLAVGVLAFIRCYNGSDGVIISFSFLTAKLIFFLIVLVLFEHFILRRLMARVERLHEGLFIIGLAWCFGVATISHEMGLFHETGAFFSGVVLARHNIARFIAEELKPLRDFFLVLFFFTMGANLDLHITLKVFFFALMLSGFAVFIRPGIFKFLFMKAGESDTFSMEAGVRLGQLSEFALLVGILALEENVITPEAGQVIQVMTLLTFVVSSYYVFYRYPTPIGIAGKLMRD